MKPRWFFFLVLLVFHATHGAAQNNFVYTNNDIIPNTVTGFAVGEDGTLTEVPDSPFLTGADGADVSDPRFFASNRIRVVGNLLYASNLRSNSVSGFSIDPETGSLTPVRGSPFPTGGVGSNGISLGASPDGRFLYAGNDFSRNVTIFAIGPEGDLTAVGNPVPAGGDSPNGMVVSPDGKWLAVALSFEGPHGAVAIFSIDPEAGELNAVQGSPFVLRDPGDPHGEAAGVDINCASDALFVGEATLRGTTIVDVLSIDPATGVLTPIEGSPFTPGVGINSNVPLLSPDDKLLFVSNQGLGSADSTVTVFTVGKDHSLTLVKGSPFPVAPPFIGPSGMATDQSGRFLYVMLFPALVGGLNIAPEGTLSPVPESPFPTGQGLNALSLAAFPARGCPLRRQ